MVRKTLKPDLVAPCAKREAPHRTMHLHGIALPEHVVLRAAGSAGMRQRHGNQVYSFSAKGAYEKTQGHGTGSCFPSACLPI